MKTFGTDSRSLAAHREQHRDDEVRAALRALLMTPLMSASHEDFRKVYRHAKVLRDWFARETGWTLRVDRESARLYKRPASVVDSTRGLPGYDRQRYVLLCLACAILERADSQITLRVLGERLLALAAEPALAISGFRFTLSSMHERRDLVAVCRSLLEFGALQRVAGDEESFVQGNVEHADALYDVRRQILSGMLAAVRGPSTVTLEDAPCTLDQRLHALADGYVADSEDARRTALRHGLACRLLDDPVLYFDTLEPDAQTYLLNQRGPMASRLCDAAGLHPEQRAEGLALTDERGELTDVTMPAEGTEAHATLLVAEYLASLVPGRQDGSTSRISMLPRPEQVCEYLRVAKNTYGKFWRRSAREPGGERELASIALSRLGMLNLIELSDGRIRPLPALARFAAGETQVTTPSDDDRPMHLPEQQTMKLL